VPTPNPTGATLSYLNGVSCTSASACIAVGNSTTGTTDEVLAERWNGKVWAITPAPSPSGATLSNLNGVSCTSASACTAVGYYASGSSNLPLAERWNGTTWAIQKMRNPSGATLSNLNGVSCTSASACTAVGSTNVGSANVSTYTLAEHWNGEVWAIQKAPTFSADEIGYLDGVSCTSASACTAVGSYGDGTNNAGLAERWNGKVWAVQPTVGPNGNAVLQAVSCTSASVCTAVGSYFLQSDAFGALAERWNGTTWTSQSMPVPSQAENVSVSGVSCTSASSCTAIGSAVATLAERWNGTTWTIQTTRNPGNDGNGLESVSCTSASACTAVGSYSPSLGSVLTLAERYGPSGGVSSRRRVA
jgi:hypothetical protein